MCNLICACAWILRTHNSVYGILFIVFCFSPVRFCLPILWNEMANHQTLYLILNGYHWYVLLKAVKRHENMVTLRVPLPPRIKGMSNLAHWVKRNVGIVFRIRLLVLLWHRVGIMSTCLGLSTDISVCNYIYRAKELYVASLCLSCHRVPDVAWIHYFYERILHCYWFITFKVTHQLLIKFYIIIYHIKLFKR